MLEEPFATPLGAIWPVIIHDPFTCGVVHGVSRVKEQRLITAERDGYICPRYVTALPFNQPVFGRMSQQVAKSFPAERTYWSSLRTLSP